MTAATLQINPETHQKHDFGLGFLILRGQPFQNAHLALATAALKRCDTLLMLVGSSNKAPSYKNPFTYGERKTMIEACLADEVAAGRVIVKPCPDFHLDNDGWFANTRRLVEETRSEIARSLGLLALPTVGIAGFKKDDSSYYIDEFPDYGDMTVTMKIGNIDATKIREAYFSRESRTLEGDVPTPVLEFLRRYRTTAAFERLVREREEIDHCRVKYVGENHTGDILILHRGLALLIKRGGAYGHGLWAFPGGIRDKGEDYLDCSLRELDEETGLTSLNQGIDIDFLKSRVRKTIFNDRPGRDLRGIYKTTLFVIDLPDSMETPTIEPRDDAMHVQFVEYGKIDPTEFFADHHGMLMQAIA